MVDLGALHGALDRLAPFLSARAAPAVKAAAAPVAPVATWWRDCETRVAAGDDMSIWLHMSNVPLSVQNAFKVAMEIGIDTLRVDSARNVRSLMDESFDVIVLRSMNAMVLRSEHAAALRTTATCTCTRSCHLCSVTITVAARNRLSVDAPVAEGHDPNLAVTHLDVRPDPLAPGVVPWSPPDPDARIPITLLGPGQHLEMSCTVRKSNALESGQNWRAVTFIAIRDIFQFRVDREIEARYPPEVRQAIVASCPRDVFEWDEKTAQIAARRPQLCTSCGQCTRIARESARPKERAAIDALLLRAPPAASPSTRRHVEIACQERYIAIDSHPTDREMRVTCNGSLSPHSVLLAGLDYLDAQLAPIASALRDLLASPTPPPARATA
jgi:NAD-dependent dihydropyrimidine dehydrogenase PreA subunit